MYRYPTNSYISSMKNTFTESNSSFLGLFFISLTIVLISKLIFNVLALGFIKQIWDLDTQTVFYDLENGIFNYIYAHKALALFDQIGTFLLPSVVLILIFKTLKPEIIAPKKKDGLKLLLMFVILLGITQLLSYISVFIGYDFLSESVQSYLKTQQEFNTNLQDKFIDPNFNSFIFNVILLALIPAIGEELFFRAVIQNIFIKLFKNTLLGIILTSVIFGLLHFQIDNLLAIIFASILFGFIYEKSKNLSLTVILHFCFNFFALISMQALKTNLLSENKMELIANYLIIPASILVGIIVVRKKLFWKEELLLPVD